MNRPPHALVVDDDQGIIEDVRERLHSIGHVAVSVSCMDDARSSLEVKHDFDYVLLDLEIPTRFGRPSMIQHGLNLLSFLYRTQPDLPVVVMTGHGHGSSDLPATTMRHGRPVDYLRKPFAGPGDSHQTLEAAAKAAHEQRLINLRGPVELLPPLQPFAGSPRELVMEEDRITLCGVEVWCDRAVCDLRAALEMLATKTKHGAWPRIRGTAINKDLGRETSNPISKPIQRFRDACTARMREILQLSCGKYDVIADAKGGGYHLADHITVVMRGAGESDAATAPLSTADPTLNPYQEWILAQLDAGEALRQRDIVAHFARDHGALVRRDESTIKRYLSELRERGLIETGADRVIRRTADTTMSHSEPTPTKDTP